MNELVIHYNRRTKMAIIKSGAKDGNSKSAIAAKIYKEMADSETNYTRKDILAKFMTEAGLTEAGAATYYYNITKKAKEAKAAEAK
jgi:hypothetical protein